MTNKRELQIFKDIQKHISNHGTYESVLMCAVELLQHHQKRIDELMEKTEKREPVQTMPKGEMESLEDAFKRRGWFEPGTVKVGEARTGVYELCNITTKRQFREELYAGDMFNRYYRYKKTRNPDLPKPRLKRTTEVRPVADRWYVVRDRVTGRHEFRKVWVSLEGEVLLNGMDSRDTDAREHYAFLAEVPEPQEYLETKEGSK